MANILKNLKLTSVDLVRAGANQEADICLFKSKEGKKVHKMTINLDVLPENERDTLQALLAKAAVQEKSSEAAEVDKADGVNSGGRSYEPPAPQGEASTPVAEGAVEKAARDGGKPSYIGSDAPQGEASTTAHTGGFSEAAVEKADPAIQAALERLDALEKSLDMQACAEVAKKYALVGDDDLAETLYRLKKSGDANYNAYIKILDKSLALVQKTGLFQEIGKAGNGDGGSVQDKISAFATEIQKTDPAMSRAKAVAKAWENHPELVQEYDTEYKERS